MLINWNLVPCYFGNGNYPYTLFTEMEWIGKLSYMINDLNNKVNNVVEIVDNIVNVEIPGIKVRLNDLERDMDNVLNTEIPNLKSRVSQCEDDIVSNTNRIRQNELEISAINARAWMIVTKINNPIYDDDNNIRTYTLPIIPGYNFANFSCVLNADHMDTDSVKSRIPINITIPIGDNIDRTIDILDFAESGEYGTPGMITNKLTFNSDISFKISYGVDKFINFTSAHTIDDLSLSELEDIVITYLKM